MLKFGRRLIFCCLFVFCLQQFSAPLAAAGEKEERIRLLQEKMQALKAQLETMQEDRLREQPPSETPWQPILKVGEERVAYAQYAYLLGPQMRKDDLDSALQQIHYQTSTDELKERGTLFVIPTFPLAAGEQMSIETYNRELAAQILHQIGVPAAIEGGLLVAGKPINRLSLTDDPLLLIDLADCDQIMRARIFELLKSQRLFTEDGSIHRYLWELARSASPQAFSFYWQNNLAWLSLDNE
ncbi:MAG: DUF5320 domain-containing protein [Deltaproteobacteria bacterium]|jgi:hypothetical protein|nr:DUF5320 domain-containing protein [Deltaproteobacteria bacterium]MCW9049189.1 DUF5320 domain-containing protein [Deltaproteobacteria bacterium]